MTNLEYIKARNQTRVLVRREWERLRADPSVSEGEAVRRLNAFADSERERLRREFPTETAIAYHMAKMTKHTIEGQPA